MKLATVTNSEIIIETTKEGCDKDWALVEKTAEILVKDQMNCVGYGCADKGQYIHLCAQWDNFQAVEFRAAYKEARKEAIKSLK